VTAVYDPLEEPYCLSVADGPKIRRDVTPAEARRLLTLHGWDDRTIDLLFRGRPPRRIPMGCVVLHLVGPFA
jgi:hypothetical protein